MHIINGRCGDTLYIFKRYHSFRGIHSHIQNVEYLIGKMKAENQDSSCSEGDTCKE